MQADILSITCQKGTATLRKGKCGNGLTNIDYTIATPRIMGAFVGDCYDNILEGLLKATCLNAKFNALGAILYIMQCFTVSNGNVCCISQQQFFNQLFVGLSYQGNNCEL